MTLIYVKKVLKKQTFTNSYKLYQVALKIPISSSTCERSFSAMSRIKTWIGTSMLQERFNNTSILYTYILFFYVPITYIYIFGVSVRIK
jgi:hypothetical protein